MRRFLRFFLLVFLVHYTGCKRKQDFVTKTYLVMGTVLNVTLPDSCSTLCDSVFQIFKTIDSLMNPIKPWSDVYRINSSRSLVAVHPYTLECIRKAIQVSEATGGAFDITVGAIVHLWHFDEQGKYVFPEEDSILKYQKYINYRNIRISDGKIALGPHQRITLAGIAKGYAIQLAAEYLKSKGTLSGIIDAGGDLYLLGSKDGAKWRVGIRDPHEEEINRVIFLSNVACCTSGDYERYVEQGGQRYSHIFSPFTGYPVSSGVRSVTVIYKDATLCDALATAIFVLGPEKAKDLQKSFEGMEYYIITDDSTYLSEGFSRFFQE
jgi:thiamine biosynthesis lipoprotein